MLFFLDYSLLKHTMNELNDVLLQEHFVDVIRNQEFLLLPVDEISKLLASDDLNVPNEETIFHAMILWAKADPVTRKLHLARLLNHVKLPLLTPQV